MITDITLQVELSFQHRLTDLNAQLMDTARAYQDFRRYTEDEKKQLTEALVKAKERSRFVTMTLIVVMIFLILYYIFVRK